MSFHTHSGRLERWLGAAEVAQLSRAMRDFYWPVPVHGVPGNVFALPGGDFSGEIRAGSELSGAEQAVLVARKYARNRTARMGMSRKQLGAFSNLSALLNAGTGGKMQDLFFKKVGATANAIGGGMDLWTVSAQPAAGSAGAAAPGGTSPTNATTGALPFNNPANANTAHFVSAWSSSSVVNNTLLLYDRLFAVAKTMNSTATEAVTGTFSRYQGTTVLNADYPGGNFVFPSVTTVLPATAHNWTVCQYTDQGGNTAQSIPSIAGVSASVAGAIDLAANNWFMPLASGDYGVKALTQMQCSALVATGAVDFVVGHPIAFIPHPIITIMCAVDGINTAFNMALIYDNACLAFLEVVKPTTGSATYTGQIKLVAE